MTTAEPPGAGSSVRYAATAGPDDVGSRVVVRRRLPEGGQGDVLGELVRWDEQAVVVLDRHGTAHRTQRADVVAAKRVPPAPLRRGGPPDGVR